MLTMKSFLHDGFRNLPVKSKYIITVIACLKLVPVYHYHYPKNVTKENNSMLLFFPSQSFQYVYELFMSDKLLLTLPVHS